MKKIVKTIVRIALLALVALIVGMNLYTLNATRLAGDAVPMPLGVGGAVVLSGSMEPELSVGDLMIIKEQATYAIGDVVVFQDGSTAVVHRIIDMNEDTVTTKGDANNVADEPIPKDRIKGAVVAVIPLVGYAVNLIKTPVGTIVILLLAVWLLERSFRKEKVSDAQALAELRAEIEALKEAQEQSTEEASDAQEPDHGEEP